MIGTWEEESVCDLLAILASREIKDQVYDELVWPPDPKGSFHVKSFATLFTIGLCVMLFLP